MWENEWKIEPRVVQIVVFYILSRFPYCCCDIEKISNIDIKKNAGNIDIFVDRKTLDKSIYMY